MKVLAVQPSSRGVAIAVASGDAGAVTITYTAKFEFAEHEERPAGLAQIRTRLQTLIGDQKPDCVVIDPLEQHAINAQRKFISMSWFLTAEVRGVAAEAAHAAGVPTGFRDGATVTRTIGTRKGADYVKDDDFWTNEVTGKVLKGRRGVALLAISRVREG